MSFFLQGRSLTVHDKISTLRFAEVVFDRETLQKRPYDDFKKKTLKGVISKYFNNSYLGAVSSLVKEEEISLDELKQLIRDVEKAHE